jgi:2-aminoadipate transaminase
MNVHTSLDWRRLLSRRAPDLHGWLKVDVEHMWDVPDLIYLCDGAPAREQMPIDRLRRAHADAWEDAADILSYGEALGHSPLRETIAVRMARRGVQVDAERVFVTNGSQQGLDLVARALFDSGDVVVVEGPTYFGALQAFDAYQVRYRVAPMDEHGLIPEALDPLLFLEPRPKAIYTVPTYQNPTGVTLPDERRGAVLELARAANVAVIEDDPYGEIYFGDAPVQPLRALDEHVIYLGTFSKTIAPALRMGWMVAPREVLQLAMNSKEASDIMSDRFVQRAVVGVCADGWLDQHLLAAREFYRVRRDAMLAALEREMPDGVSWTHPEGGFFLWVTLPEGMAADDLLDAALRHSVGFLPGSCFYPDARRVNAFRLSWATMTPEVIAEGVRRIGLAVRELQAR